MRALGSNCSRNRSVVIESSENHADGVIIDLMLAGRHQSRVWQLLIVLHASCVWVGASWVYAHRIRDTTFTRYTGYRVTNDDFDCVLEPSDKYEICSRSSGYAQMPLLVNPYIFPQHRSHSFRQLPQDPRPDPPPN